MTFLQEYNAKLSDFGLAKDGPSGDKSHVSTRVMGTQGYAAPEYIATGNLCSMICQPVNIGLLLFWHFIINMLRKWVNETLVFHHNWFLLSYFVFHQSSFSFSLFLNFSDVEKRNILKDKDTDCVHAISVRFIYSILYGMVLHCA